MLGAFTAVLFVYATNQSDPSPGLWLGFPPSTALMLFLLWPLPALFIIVYITMFDRWFLAPEDVERFDKLVQSVDGQDS